MYATYGREVPKEWIPREMPNSLKQYGVKAHTVVHVTRARVYFYPGTPPVDYHKKRIQELSQTAYSFQGAHPDGEANLAFYCAESSEFQVISYDSQYAAIWSPGGIDVSRGLGSACGGIGTEQYGSWKPGVYFIPRKYVYITDARNQQLDIPEITASGTATCNIYVKTTPATDNYVTAGLIESNQLFEVTKTPPINGHYQIYYKQGLHVKYDEANNAIIINSMTPYKGKTPSLKKGDGKKHKVMLSTASIVWDGEVSGIPCYKIDGKYYVTTSDITDLTDSRLEPVSSGYWYIEPTRPGKIDAYG